MFQGPTAWAVGTVSSSSTCDDLPGGESVACTQAEAATFVPGAPSAAQLEDLRLDRRLSFLATLVVDRHHDLGLAFLIGERRRGDVDAPVTDMHR